MFSRSWAARLSSRLPALGLAESAPAATGCPPPPVLSCGVAASRRQRRVDPRPDSR